MKIVLKYMVQIILIGAFLLGCDDFPNTPELANKLRTMGVGSDEPAYTYSTDNTESVAKLSFYFATPDKAELSSENFQIEAVTIPLEFSDAELVEEKASLNIYKINATAVVPPATQLIFNPVEDNTATVSYAAVFRQGQEEEIVFGKIRVYSPEVASSGEIKIPTVTITNRKEGDKVKAGTIALKGEVGNKIEESYRTGWLVSTGKIEDFRKREADWEEASKGETTVIMTVRGLESYNFNYQAIDITIE